MCKSCKRVEKVLEDYDFGRIRRTKYAKESTVAIKRILNIYKPVIRVTITASGKSRFQGGCSKAKKVYRQLLNTTNRIFFGNYYSPYILLSKIKDIQWAKRC